MSFLDQFYQSFNNFSNPMNQPVPQLPARPMQVPPVQPLNYPVTSTGAPVPGVDPSEELFEAFKQNVLNPPKRTQMTYPQNTLAGLTKALDVARTPTDYEKNRVYIDGNAYQKARVFDDPETGKRHFIEPYKQPGFMEQVMKAMPEAVSPAVDILNQPRKDALEDWDLRNKGLAAAINAQSQMELARQRGATADWYSARPDIERDKAAISRLRADEYVRASQLKTMTDRELEAARLSGRITVAEYNAAAAMKRVEAQQAGANYRTERNIQGREALERIRQAGRLTLEEAQALNNEELEALRHDNRLDLESRMQINREINIRLRGQQSRETKQTPSGTVNASETQQKQGAINKATQILNANPQWKDIIVFDTQTGMPRLEPPNDPYFGSPDWTEYDKAFEALYGRPRPGVPSNKPPGPDVNLPAAPAAPPQITPTQTAPVNPAANANPTQPAPAPPKPPAPNTGGGRGGGSGRGLVGEPSREEINAKTKDNARIQKAASDLLRQNGKPVTPANIEWVIKQGMVK